MYIYLTVCKKVTDDQLNLLHSNTWKNLTVCKQMINSEYNYLCKIEILETI